MGGARASASRGYLWLVMASAHAAPPVGARVPRASLAAPRVAPIIGQRGGPGPGTPPSTERGRSSVAASRLGLEPRSPLGGGGEGEARRSSREQAKTKKLSRSSREVGCVRAPCALGLLPARSPGVRLVNWRLTTSDPGHRPCDYRRCAWLPRLRRVSPRPDLPGASPRNLVNEVAHVNSPCRTPRRRAPKGSRRQGVGCAVRSPGGCAPGEHPPGDRRGQLML